MFSQRPDGRKQWVSDHQTAKIKKINKKQSEQQMTDKRTDEKCWKTHKQTRKVSLPRCTAL